MHFENMNLGSDCLLLSNISALTGNQEVIFAYFSVWWWWFYFYHFICLFIYCNVR